MNRSLKRRFARNIGQQGVELENHFILRLPNPQANVVRDLLHSNQCSNIKERLNIQLDYTGDKDDMRNGIITVDTIMHKARLVDIPTIMESWKTIDGKNFYKTADICQMLMVREGEDPAEEEESKKKRRDHPNRVDKKYLWPHGYTPPLKNVRKRRFRKMLRKKILELPEIEKEVKRLLRADEEATNVKWEVLREDEEKGGAGGSVGGGGGGDQRHRHHHDPDDSRHNAATNLDEQLFGELLSSSEDEVGINILDEDDDSRLSVDDTRFSESYMQENTNSPHPGGSRMHAQGPSMSAGGSPPYPSSYGGSQQPPGSGGGSSSQAYYTEFNPSMFQSDAGSSMFQSMGGHSSTSAMFVGEESGYENIMEGSDGTTTTLLGNALPLEDGGLHGGNHRASMMSQAAVLESELRELTQERAKHQSQMDSLDNAALKSRFLSKLQENTSAMHDKEEQLRRIQTALQ